MSSREEWAGCGARDPLVVGNRRGLAIRKPGEAAPPAPEPEEREDDEEEEEVRRRAELRGVRATSLPRRPFRRWGLLAPRGRDDAPLRAGRLEGATWRGSRGRLRLLGHPSDALPQWYLTLRRSDAMGTFPVPVVCPSQCCGFQGRHSAPRRAHGPSAEPHDALPCCRGPSATIHNAAPLPSRQGASGAAQRRSTFRSPSRGSERRRSSRPLGCSRPQAPDAKGGPRAGWPLGSRRPAPPRA